MKILSYFRKKKKEEVYGMRVRDFLLMLEAEREEYRFDHEAELEEAICCVEAAYPSIEPKVGRKPDIRKPVSFVRNRLMVLINFYSWRRYGYGKCFDGECGEKRPDCPEKCRFRGWEDEYCNMLREAIRCVEVMGTGVPEPTTISLEELR